MDIINLSNDEQVYISVIDYDYREEEFMSSFMVRVVFDEDEFSFQYNLIDNEDPDIDIYDACEDLFLHVAISKIYTSYDMEKIKDCIESEIRQVAI